LARFTEESKQRVRDATDLVELAGEYTELRRAGADRMIGLCPLHDERTPSFTISPTKQLFKCFGCDAGGDVLSLVQSKEGLDFPAALEFLARRAGIELQREDEDPGVAARRARRVRELVPLDRAAAFYAAHLRRPRSPEAAQAAEYLASRGIDEATRETFALGFAPPEKTALLRSAQSAGFSAKELSDVGLVSRPRGGGPLQDRFRGQLMFPVCDMRGRVLGFGARKVGSARGPKYINSPSGAIYCKSELLYGAHHARAAAAKAGAVIVVEGYLDALAMHQAGIVNTVALMGTAVSEGQMSVVKRLAPTVVLMLDGDEAGYEAVLRAGALARAVGLEALVARLPHGSDPAAVLQRDGGDVVRDLVAGAVALARFCVLHQVERADVSSAERKDRLLGELRDVFAGMPPSALREDLIQLVADRLSLSPALVTSVLASAEPRSGQCPPQSSREPPPELNAGSQYRLLQRCLAEPEAAAALPTGAALADRFCDALSRRAAEHIRTHPLDPTAALPDHDHELVSFITGLLTAPSGDEGESLCAR
jgi:DNA primase